MKEKRRSAPNGSDRIADSLPERRKAQNGDRALWPWMTRTVLNPRWRAARSRPHGPRATPGARRLFNLGAGRGSPLTHAAG
jgi:hypothetical protein